MLAQADATVWLAQLGPHTGYAAGVLGPIILAGLGRGMVISTSASTGTFGVAQVPDQSGRSDDLPPERRTLIPRHPRR